MRERYAPDGALGLRERLAMISGVLGLGASLALIIGLQHHNQALAGERYEAEMRHDFDPLPVAVRTASWSLRGRVERGGTVAIEVAGRLENHGAEAKQLAFSLNQGLELEHFAAPPHRVTTRRSWDRLLVTLDPPLAAGAAVRLEARVAGVPSHIDFFPRRGDYPFVMRYERLRNARFVNEMSDLSRAPVWRAVSERRVALKITDLGPMPRYTPWTLTLPNSEDDDYLSDIGLFGRNVPRETRRPAVDLELDLDLPSRWFLADTCGHVSRPDGDRARLRGRCRTALVDFEIRGGPMVVLEEGKGPADAGRQAPAGNVILAAFPAHREQAESQRRSLALVASLSDRAWPGMKGLEGLVALEWPPPPYLDLRSRMQSWNRPRVELYGQLLVIPELLLINRRPMKPEDLVAMLLSRDLLARREVVEDQQDLFRNFFAALMLRRMGLVESGSTVSGPPWMRQALRIPILQAAPFAGYTWKRRLPAVLVEIESRAGGDHFYAGIESFLSAESDQPGNFRELLAEVESRAGVSLERIYQDHFLGQALPALQLEGVRSERQDGRWIVHGVLRNIGTGESICPVIVKTEITERVLRVRVDSESQTPFSVRVATRPHTVLLDPERTCYRFRIKNFEPLERINVLN